MKHLKLSLITGIIFLSIISQAQTLPSNVPSNGLVGYWPFDGNANDISGNGNHGTVYGATLTDNSVVTVEFGEKFNKI